MPDPAVSTSDSELRAHVERALSQHYELDSEIGRGGMGIVYRAKDRRLKRVVAIKVLPPELAFRSEIKTRFLREAETAAQLNHPNIVDIYSVDEAEQLVYFVMAYISGDNLAKRLHDHGALSVDETRRTLRDVADALAYAHERGVIHRDIKPDNILIDAQSGRPMVTDFGIARAVTEGDSRLTATGIAIGTPTYMSPEQAAGERTIDGRSDIYALGIVGYQMLIGEPPFMANSTPAILVKHISERPMPIEQRRGDVPQDLARIVMLMLEKDPANRFPSASAVVAALDTGAMPDRGVRSSESGIREPALPAAPPRTSYGSGTPARSSFPTAETAYGPSADELRRWEAPEVQKFRRKLAPYIFVNAVIVLASLVGQSDFFGLTVLWSIYLAFKYAKLWADGYDWRDVFRQPRERELIDVAEDFLAYMRAIVDPKQRRELREQRQARRLSGGSSRSSASRAAYASTEDAMRVAGPYAEKVRRAESDCHEILQVYDRLSPSDKARVGEVVRSASTLAEKVRVLAISLAELDRTAAPSAAQDLEAEIARLESAANPLDAASEDRVRRLALLRRQRRGLADAVAKRNSVAAKLETCGLALQNMKFDIIRLHAGAQTHQHVTSLAMDALSLADSVDSALYVADEMGATSERAARRPARKG